MTTEQANAKFLHMLETMLSVGLMLPALVSNKI